MMEHKQALVNKESLMGEAPAEWLLHHGPKKRLVDKYHWHVPDVGIIASYTPTETDVEDHFNVFRWVDQIESFAQAVVGSCSVFLQCRKENKTPAELKNSIIPSFMGIGRVDFYSYLEKGDTFVNIGYIKSYKFRQMVADGRIYKVPKDLDLDAYFSTFTQQQLLNFEVGTDFVLIAELQDITGRGIKTELFKNK